MAIAPGGSQLDRSAPPPLPPRRDVELVEFDRYIDTQLHKTRLQVKGVEIVGSLLTLAVGSLVYLLGVALIDHWVVAGGLGPWSRAFFLVVFVAGVVAYSARTLWPLLVHRINPVYAAQAIEQSRPSLKNSLVNFLLLRNRPGALTPTVFAAVERQAASGLSEVSIEHAVDRSRLVKIGYVLLGAVAVCAAYKLISPKDPLRSFSRVIAPWADIAPPTRVQFREIAPGNGQGFHDALVSVTAEVSGLADGEPVTIYYSTTDGQIVDQPVGMHLPAGEFRYVGDLPADSAGLQQDLEYYLVAGDAVSPRYRLEVLTTPSIVVDRVDYEFPKYTEIDARSADRQGDLKGIEGTRVTLHATANDDIGSAYVDFNCDGRRDLPMQVTGREATVSFTLALADRSKSDQAEHSSYQLRFTNPQGQENPKPVRHQIEVTRDVPPEIAFVEPSAIAAPKPDTAPPADGKGKQPTADAAQPAPAAPPGELTVPEGGGVKLVVEAADADFKLGAVTLVAERNGRKLLDKQLLPAPLAGQFRGPFLLDTRSLGLKAGDEVKFWAVADDNRTPDPNRVATARHTLRIASPDAKRPQDQLAKNDPRQDKQQDKRQDKNPRNDQQQRGDKGQPGDQPPPQGGDQPEDAEQNQDPQRGDNQPQRGGKRPDDGQQPQGSDNQENQDSANNERANDKNDQNDRQPDDNDQSDQQEKQGGGGKSDGGQGEQSSGESGSGSSGGQSKESGDAGKSKSGQGGNNSGKPNESGDADPNRQDPAGDSNPDDAQNDSGQPRGKSGKPRAGKSGNSDSGSDQPVDGDAQPGDAIEKILNRQREQEQQQSAGDKSRQPTDAGQSGEQERGDARPSPMQQPGQGDPQRGNDQQKPDGSNSRNEQPAGEQPREPQAKPGQPSAGEKNTAGDKSEAKPGEKNAAKPGDQTSAGEKPGANPQKPAGAEQPQPGGEQKNATGDNLQNGTGQKPGDMTKPGDQTGAAQAGDKNSADKNAADKNATGKSSAAPQRGDQPADPNATEQGEQKTPGEKSGDMPKPGDQAQQPGGPSEQPGDKSPQAGDDAQQNKSGNGGQSGNQIQKPDQKPPAKKEPGGKQPDAQGGEAERKDKGAAGAGQNDGSQTGSPTPQETGHPRDKKSDTTGGGTKPGDEEKPDSPGGSKKESDSKGGESGDQEGGGGKGGGQPSPSPGTGSPGQNTAADEGSGRGAGSGEGDKSDSAGDKMKGQPKEGQGKPSEEKGAGSKTQPGGEKPGAAEQSAQPGEQKPPQQPGVGGGRFGGPKSNPNQQPPAGNEASKSGQQPGGNQSGDQQPGKPSANQPSGAAGGNPTGGGLPPESENLPPAGPAPDTEPGGDAANLEYSRKATDLALEYLKDQLAKENPDKKLLDDLKWTREDAERFVKRWEKMKQDAKQAGPDGKAKQELDDALKSLGLRPRGTRITGGTKRESNSPTVRDTRRTKPPAGYEEQYRVFTKGVARGAQESEK